MDILVLFHSFKKNATITQPFLHKTSSVEPKRKHCKAGLELKVYDLCGYWKMSETDGTLAHFIIGSAEALPIYYRKRGSASYIVREVLSVRERERERERYRERKTEVTSPLSR